MQAGPRAVVAALFATMLVIGAAPLAQAGGHMSLYVLTPEHDDAGRSDEPNFEGTSSVLGVSVHERVVDRDLDGIAEAYSVATRVAPGCSDDSGRQPSGACFLYWRTGTVGVQGMSGPSAPGSFTPLKSTQVRFMDLMGTFQAVRAYVEVNQKVDDTGARPLLRQVDPNYGNNFILPSVGHTMWYGVWQDKNGNGVIDADGTGCTVNGCGAGEQQRNEFQWRGQCKTFTGNPSEVPNWVCSIEDPSDIYVWGFPGNHHASTNGANALFTPVDVPGQQALCFANAATFHTVGGAGVLACPSRIQDIEENDATLDIGAGDPLLGPQDTLRPDFTMAHRTGDPNINTRHLVAGLGWAVYHYDQSVVVSYETTASVNPSPDSSGRLFSPNSGQFVDVDRYGSFSPVAQSIVQDQVKPAVRPQWVFVRDSYIPINNFVDGRVQSKSTGLGAAQDTVGAIDDSAIDPGWSHEPNHPLDVYPFVVRGAATHTGSTNNYAGYQSLRPDGRGHLWADVQMFRTVPLVRPDPSVISGIIGVPLPSPPLAAGPFLIDQRSPAVPPRGANDHTRTLLPGLYDFLGGMGAWHDKVQVNDEEVFGSPLNSYKSGPDGWVGNVVNSTGQFQYRDYMPTACTRNGVTGTHQYAECDPYAGGTISDPNDYATSDGEMRVGCGGIGGPVGKLEVIPVGGTWTVPIFVYRSIEEMRLGDTTQIEDFTGKSTAITISIRCAQNTLVSAGDYVLFPIGNPALTVLTKWTAQVNTVPGEVVVDVDQYNPLV